MKMVSVEAENGEIVNFLTDWGSEGTEEPYVGLKGECSISHEQIKKKIDGLVSIFKTDESLSSKSIQEIKIECGIIIEAGSNIFFASGSTKGSIKLTITIK